MHKVMCVSVPIYVDVEEINSCHEVAYFEPVDVDVRKRKKTYCHDHLQESEFSMFAIKM
jgi:hypothetical protein